MGPAIVLFVQTAIFWIRHRNVDEDAYMTYDSESDVEPETVLGQDAKIAEAGAEAEAPVYEKH